MSSAPEEMMRQELADPREKITILELRNTQLQDEIKKMDSDRRVLESELFRLQAEVRRLKNELERLKTPPMIIGSIRDILADGRVVVKSSTGPDFIVITADYLPKEMLAVGARVALNKQSLAVMSVLPPSLDPLVVGAEIIEKPNFSYDDVGGLRDQIVEVREAVEDPLLKPELYKKVGIEPPKGVLLVGPPGCGKTLLAKAVAHQTNATFIRLVGSELVQKYIGEGARLVRELFSLAREKSPSIVFIDELDAIGAKRLELGTSGDREVQRTLMQLLAELDGFNPLGNVRIIGATNRPDILDEALLRPGRFDRIIQISVPQNDARLEIFRIHIKKMNLAGDVSIDAVSAKCEGATGADIKAICTESGMFAIRENRDSISQLDFDKAIEKVMAEETPGVTEAGAMFA